MKTPILGIVIILMTIGGVIALLLLPSDTVRHEFKTLDAAIQANAFSRGWLPPLLPDGSTEIVELNDVDLNVGLGSFRYPSESTSAFLEQLSVQYGVLVNNTAAGHVIVVTNATTRWEIELEPSRNRGAYTVKYNRRSPNQASEATSGSAPSAPPEAPQG